jgi:hypothetical protein
MRGNYGYLKGILILALILFIGWCSVHDFKKVKSITNNFSDSSGIVILRNNDASVTINEVYIDGKRFEDPASRSYNDSSKIFEFLVDDSFSYLKLYPNAKKKLKYGSEVIIKGETNIAERMYWGEEHEDFFERKTHKHGHKESDGKFKKFKLKLEYVSDSEFYEDKKNKELFRDLENEYNEDNDLISLICLVLLKNDEKSIVKLKNSSDSSYLKNSVISILKYRNSNTDKSKQELPPAIPVTP